LGDKAHYLHQSVVITGSGPLKEQAMTNPISSWQVTSLVPNTWPDGRLPYRRLKKKLDAFFMIILGRFWLQ
jgi:hypothetical protein